MNLASKSSSVSTLPLFFVLLAAPLVAENGEVADRFRPIDVFDLEYAGDPQISPDGSRVIYVRSFFDILTDRARSNLWMVDADGSDHRPLTTGNANDRSPRWSPDGGRVAFVSSRDGGSRSTCAGWTAVRPPS